MNRARRKAKKEARQAMAQDTKRTARAAVDLSRKAAAAKAAKSLIGALSASDYFNGFKTDSSIIRLPPNKENFFIRHAPRDRRFLFAEHVI